MEPTFRLECKDKGINPNNNNNPRADLFFFFFFLSSPFPLLSLSLFSSVFVSATSASFASVLVARAGQGRKGRVRGGSSSLPEMLQPTRAL